MRLRLALEALGPIFVKFGQMLSTRRDLVPLDIADELAKLQDRVPPFPSAEAARDAGASVQEAAGRSVRRIRCHPDRFRLGGAGALRAVLHDGTAVAVKMLRPGIAPVIAHDVSLLYAAAGLIEKLFADGKRLTPARGGGGIRKAPAGRARPDARSRQLLAAAAQFQGFADCCWCRRCTGITAVTDVMVMERMDGIPVSQIERLRESGVDIPKLAATGVEIFFTQVFRDGFFHADMHPGNILVTPDGQYVALDFGIMGTLTEVDKQYLAHNFLAFFRRDYKGVALAHLESGWVPADTRVDELEAAVRAVCEPVFDRPLKDISFGRVLLQLFQASRRFNVEIQPQLVLLQKTLLNIEGLGRQLDPELDLWKTAKPFLERWMNEQIGWRALVKNLQDRSAQMGGAAAATAAPGASGAERKPAGPAGSRPHPHAAPAARPQPLARRHRRPARRAGGRHPLFQPAIRAPPC